MEPTRKNVTCTPRSANPSSRTGVLDDEGPSSNVSAISFSGGAAPSTVAAGQRGVRVHRYEKTARAEMRQKKRDRRDKNTHRFPKGNRQRTSTFYAGQRGFILVCCGGKTVGFQRGSIYFPRTLVYYKSYYVQKESIAVSWNIPSII